MASPDVQIVRAGPVAAPLDYVLPSTAGLQPLVVTADFDGSAAASGFLPCVTIIGPSGTVIAETASDTTVPAGGSARASFFPGVKHATAATTATGSVISAYVDRSSTDTFGPSSAHLAHFSTFVTNDSTVFSQPTNFQVKMTHGGQLRCDVTGQFGTNGGVVYSGEMGIAVDVFDALNNPVDQMTGQPVFYSELYATDPGDTFNVNGTCTFNADDTFYTPPYTVKMFIDVQVNVTFINYAMFVAIENPTGLT